MPCLDTENNFSPGDTEAIILRKILNRLCNVSSGGGGGVSQAYVDAGDAATLLAANNNAVAGDAAVMSSASALYVLKSGDTMTGSLNMTSGQAFNYNSVPIARGITALRDYFFGGAGNLTMTGVDNIAIGINSLAANTIGIENTVIGSDAMPLNTTSSGNTGVGFNVLAVTTGEQNTAVGRRALVGNTTGSSNVGVGYRTLAGVTTGSNNMGLGYLAGDNLTTGSNNLILGGNSIDFPSATDSNQINIGNIIFATGASGTGTTIAGLVGVGVNTPTAALHLKAGTATANTAPLKLTSGTLLTAPEAGAIEFLTDTFYGTTTTGPTRKAFAFLESGAASFTPGSVIFAGATGVLQQDNANFFWDDTNNRLGIGTTSPGALLEIYKASGGTQIKLSNDFGAFGRTSDLSFGQNGGNIFAKIGSIYEAADNHGLVFYTTTDSGATLPERVRIDNVGNVGIGIAAPLARLHITPAASGTDYFRIDHSDGTPRLQVGVYPAVPTLAAVWLGNIVPDSDNWSLIKDSTQLALSAPSGGSLLMCINGSAKWSINSSGHLLAGIDNTYNIGATGASRPANVDVGTKITTLHLTQTAGGLFSVTSGANQRAGNATLVAGTVTVSNTTVTANTIVLLTRKSTGGTIGFAVTYTVSVSTSFTISSDNVLDTSTYSYLLIEVP